MSTQQIDWESLYEEFLRDYQNRTIMIDDERRLLSAEYGSPMWKEITETGLTVCFNEGSMRAVYPEERIRNKLRERVGELVGRITSSYPVSVNVHREEYYVTYHFHSR